jgi:hypothetical protein
MATAQSAASQFCASPDFKKLTCGFASEAEQTAALKQCVLCGTRFRPLPDKLPAEITGNRNYNHWQTGAKPISLACKGPIVVRSVFKLVEQPTVKQAPGWAGTDCTYSSLTHVDEDGRGASPVIRCELELPSTGGSEAERALKAKEGKCWACGLCSDGQGCPSAVGKWYSDSYTTVAQGCGFDAQKGPIMHRAGFNINPGAKVLLAKFEVCNSQGCFDPAVEKAKQQAAKQCVKGKCAA